MRQLIKEVIKETNVIDWVLIFVSVICWAIWFFSYRTGYELITFISATAITIINFKIIERDV